MQPELTFTNIFSKTWFSLNEIKHLWSNNGTLVLTANLFTPILIIWIFPKDRDNQFYPYFNNYHQVQRKKTCYTDLEIFKDLLNRFKNLQKCWFLARPTKMVRQNLKILQHLVQNSLSVCVCVCVCVCVTNLGRYELKDWNIRSIISLKTSIRRKLRA